MQDYFAPLVNKGVTIGAGIAVVIIVIIIGLIVYSYTQIQISLDDISFAGFVWNLSGISILKAGISLLTGNLLGTILSVITGINLNLIFGLSNHGIFPVYIPDLTYDLFVNDIKLGQGHSNVDLTINPGDTKQLPILENFQFNSLGPAASSVIESNGIMNIKVSGTAYFKFLGLSIPVPFESTKQVSVVDEAKKYINEKLSGQYASSYQTPSVQTNIFLQASTYDATEGQSVIFSGYLKDSSGNGISNQLISVKRDISLAPDSVLGNSYTDSNGYFSISWIAVMPLTSNNADIYATFEGSSGYSSVRGSDISIQVYAQQTQTTQNPSSSLEQQLQQAHQNVQASNSVTIANSVYKVGPGTSASIQFYSPCSSTVTGSFSAEAALGDNIIVYLLDQDNYNTYKNGNLPQAYYYSGKVSTGNFNISLSPGTYYIIMSNSYSSFSTKTVTLQTSYTCN